jgi:hypothetical protein
MTHLFNSFGGGVGIMWFNPHTMDVLGWMLVRIKRGKNIYLSKANQKKELLHSQLSLRKCPHFQCG